MKKFLFSLVVLLPFACSKDDDQGTGQLIDVQYDYVVFGDYYGECIRECVHIYKLQGSELYADKVGRYPTVTAPYAGDYSTKLSPALHQEVSIIPGSIPYETLKKGDTVVGNPDGADWGGIYLEVSINGEVDYWLLDKKQENLPNNLKTFVTAIDEKIELLKASGN